ncbi:hypothetical protein J6590_020885 [Homalodisca vitripennis]|nr:hypothetical protein J6590_020885 [Homalodisca vitripennis]
MRVSHSTNRSQPVCNLLTPPLTQSPTSDSRHRREDGGRTHIQRSPCKKASPPHSGTQYYGEGERQVFCPPSQPLVSGLYFYTQSALRSDRIRICKELFKQNSS